GLLNLWDLQSRRLLWDPSGWWFRNENLAFAPDGQRLATASFRIVAIREARTGKVLGQISEHSLWSRTVAYSPDGKWLASAGDNKSVLIWDVASGQTIDFPVVGASTLGLLGSPLQPGPLCAAVALLPRKARPLQVLEGHTDSVRSLAFTP